MKKNVIISILCLSTMLFLLTGWESHISGSLTTKHPSFIKQEVQVHAKAYTKEDSELNLGKNLLSKGYRPIQVIVQNNSPHSFLFSAESISLHLTPPKDVALKIVTADAIPRSIAFKIAGMLFWPLSLPGAIDTIKTFESQKLLKKDYSAKGIREVDEVIPPYSTVTRILFVKKEDFYDSFTVSLKDLRTDELNNFLIENIES